MARITVGPFNRVEGDLEVRLEVEDGQVREARVVSPLYRGFEQILHGKDPRDALVIAPRICGICSVSQSMAAAYALADVQRLAMPPNGELATNLVLACENLADHLTHFYLFFMPDFAREVYATEPWYPGGRRALPRPAGRGRARNARGPCPVHAPHGHPGREVAPQPEPPAGRQHPCRAAPGAHPPGRDPRGVPALPGAPHLRRRAGADRRSRQPGGPRGLARPRWGWRPASLPTPRGCPRARSARPGTGPLSELRRLSHRRGSSRSAMVTGAMVPNRWISTASARM